MTSILIFNSRPEHEFKRQTAGSSGWDLCANIEGWYELLPRERLVIPTGIHLAMPLGVEAQVRGRSGLAAKHGVIAAPGTVDSDFRGECKVTLMNLGDEDFIVTPGMRIAQLVFAPVYVLGGSKRLVDVDAFEFVTSLTDLPASDRGAGGHGSTGL